MKNHHSLLTKVFYLVKPILSRRFQLFLRRRRALIIRNKNLTTWPINPITAMLPEKWKGWPENKKFALVLNHDVDTQTGHDQCRQLMDLEEQLGVRSTFYIVPERYKLSQSLLKEIKQRGFGLGIHGLKHDGKLFLNYQRFLNNAQRINKYINDWGIRGFSAPSMLHRLEWMHHLNIDYSTSTFDTDPFEPQPEAAHTIFPYFVHNNDSKKPFLELPYTLPQDFTLFCILREKSIAIWKSKLAWIAEHNGMALINTHPDYMNFENRQENPDEYPVAYFRDFILHIKEHYTTTFFNPLSSELYEYFISPGKGLL